jgi:hypothetical protein
MVSHRITHSQARHGRGINYYPTCANQRRTGADAGCRIVSQIQREQRSSLERLQHEHLWRDTETDMGMWWHRGNSDAATIIEASVPIVSLVVVWPCPHLPIGASHGRFGLPLDKWQWRLWSGSPATANCLWFEMQETRLVCHGLWPQVLLLKLLMMAYFRSNVLQLHGLEGNALGIANMLQTCYHE